MLYTLAAQFKRKALSVNTVADHFEKDITVFEETDIGPVPTKMQDMTPEERERGFSEMIEGVLNIWFAFVFPLEVGQNLYQTQ